MKNFSLDHHRHAGGCTYTVQIITGNSSTDHKDGVDFLLQGCGHHTATTTTTSTTTTTKTSSTSTTSTTTTTTPPTTAPVCHCDGIPFLAASGPFRREPMASSRC